MSLHAGKIKNTGGGKRRSPAPAFSAGTYPGRLVQVIDLGVQEQRPYQGQEKPPAPEIMVTFELVDEFLPVYDEDSDTYSDTEFDEEKPRWLSNTFPLRSLDSDLATSTKYYRAIDTKGEFEGDWSAIIGMPVNVTVVENISKKDGVVRNYISGLAPIRPKDAEKLPDLKNPPKVLSLDSDDVETFKSLPDWLQDKIKNGLEFEGTALSNALGGTTKKDTNSEDEAW